MKYSDLDFQERLDLISEKCSDIMDTLTLESYDFILGKAPQKPVNKYLSNTNIMFRLYDVLKTIEDIARFQDGDDEWIIVKKSDWDALQNDED